MDFHTTKIILKHGTEDGQVQSGMLMSVYIKLLNFKKNNATLNMNVGIFFEENQELSQSNCS